MSGSRASYSCVVFCIVWKFGLQRAQPHARTPWRSNTTWICVGFEDFRDLQICVCSLGSTAIAMIANYTEQPPPAHSEHCPRLFGMLDSGPRRKIGITQLLIALLPNASTAPVTDTKLRAVYPIPIIRLHATCSARLLVGLNVVLQDNMHKHKQSHPYLTCMEATRFAMERFSHSFYRQSLAGNMQALVHTANQSSQKRGESRSCPPIGVAFALWCTKRSATDKMHTPCVLTMVGQTCNLSLTIFIGSLRAARCKCWPAWRIN